MFNYYLTQGFQCSSEIFRNSLKNTILGVLIQDCNMQRKSSEMIEVLNMKVSNDYIVNIICLIDTSVNQ